jgi:glycyl-tRNA synthetase
MVSQNVFLFLTNKNNITVSGVLMELHERIYELSVTRSFFIPSNEPYGATRGFYDYGPIGKLIKNKIERLWRQIFIKEEGFHEVETSMITPEIVLQASGHAANFADPILECKECKTRLRADTLVEEKLIEKHGAKWDGKLETIDNTVAEEKIKCPKCKGEFEKARMFNLMFKTGIGGEQAPAFSRPETAQGIFTAFPRLFRNHGAKLPLGVAQIGKSFRNEISPRKGLVRMREFTQMELEYFFDPVDQQYPGFESIKEMKMRFGMGKDVVNKSAQESVSQKIATNQIMAYFLAKQWEFYKAVGIPEEKMFLRVLDKEEIPHYSKGNIDMEVETSYGLIETIGNAYRTDFDLSAHAKFSKKDFSVFLQNRGEKIIPHVFEVSMGVDRLFFAILEHCFRDKQDPEHKTENGKDWEWFDFPPVIAPYEVSVFPLMRKDGQPEKAREIAAMLRKHFDVFYQEGGSIGRRYARTDEIGCAYAITVDYDTSKDDTVTIRYRNDGKQERIKIDDCVALIRKNIANGRVSL